MDTKEFVFPNELLEETDVLCLFGFDSSYVEKKLESWISSGDKHILLVQTKDLSDLEDFQKLSKQRVFQRFSYLVSPFLENQQQEEMKWLAMHYQTVQWHTHLEASDYQDFGVKVFRNLCDNYRSGVEDSFSLLKNSLKGVPAFICGAGPSLTKAIPHLQKLQNQGVVFAGGAALGALSSSNVPIDIAAGIDPDPSSDRFLLQDSFDAPFFYQSRFSSSLLSLVQGPLFQVPSSSGLQIEDKSSFDAGCTVTTFCAALALHLGCSPLIFVGMDLAYEDETTKYAQKLPGKQESSATVLYEDLHTQKDWVIAAKWLENLATTYPDVSFYTVGDQGLSLKGFQRVTFSKMIEKMDYSYDLGSLIHLLKMQGETKDSFLIERLEKREKIQKSLKDSLIQIDSILSLFEKAYPEDPSSQGPFILHLFALYNEIVYQHLLEPLWNVWRFPLERNLHTEYEKKLHQCLFFKRVLEDHLS